MGLSRLQLGVAVIALSFLPAAQALGAGENSGEREGQSAPDGTDAVELSRELGVEEEEAREILAAQIASHDIRRELRQASGETFVKIRFEAKSPPRLVLVITGEEAPPALQEVTNRSPVPVDIRLTNVPPESEFMELVDRTWTEFSATPGLRSQDADPETATITFYFEHAEGEELSAFRDAVARAVSDERVTIKAEIVDPPEQLTRRGGNPLRRTVDKNPECTQGFSVQKQGGSKGVLTAAHCVNNLQ